MADIDLGYPVIRVIPPATKPVAVVPVVGSPGPQGDPGDMSLDEVEADVLATLEPPINLVVLYQNARTGGNQA